MPSKHFLQIDVCHSASAKLWKSTKHKSRHQSIIEMEMEMEVDFAASFWANNTQNTKKKLLIKYHQFQKRIE